MIRATREEVGLSDWHFADLIHMNRDGARKFSEWVCETLPLLISEAITLAYRPGKEIWPIHSTSELVEELAINLCLGVCESMPRGGQLVLAPDGRRAALITGDSVQLSDLATGKQVTLETTLRPAACVAFEATGAALAAGHLDGADREVVDHRRLARPLGLAPGHQPDGPGAQPDQPSI